MAMVIPRSRSSGALSIWSYARNLAKFFLASTLVIAAVSVVLPWSTCPIVPTFTCGFVRSNLPFAIVVPYSRAGPVRTGTFGELSGRSLLVDDRVGHALRRFRVVLEFHGVRRSSLL